MTHYCATYDHIEGEIMTDPELECFETEAEMHCHLACTHNENEFDDHFDEPMRVEYVRGTVGGVAVDIWVAIVVPVASKSVSTN